MAADWGRIHRGLWRHKKRQQITLAALGLWADGISWSKDRGTRGFIPADEVTNHPGLVEQLLQARMWIKVDGGYRYNDWDDWNYDERPVTTGARMVYDILGERYPQAVRSSLAREVAKLLEEGQEAEVIARALHLWEKRPNAGPSLLPHLVADALKDSGDDIQALIKQCMETGDVTPLRKHGHWFPEPDPPAHIKTAAEMRHYMLNQKRRWLSQLQKEVA